MNRAFVFLAAALPVLAIRASAATTVPERIPESLPEADEVQRINASNNECGSGVAGKADDCPDNQRCKDRFPAVPECSNLGGSMDTVGGGANRNCDACKPGLRAVASGTMNGSKPGTYPLVCGGTPTKYADHYDCMDGKKKVVSSACCQCCDDQVRGDKVVGVLMTYCQCNNTWR